MAAILGPLSHVYIGPAPSQAINIISPTVSTQSTSSVGLNGKDLTSLLQGFDESIDCDDAHADKPIVKRGRDSFLNDVAELAAKAESDEAAFNAIGSLESRIKDIVKKNKFHGIKLTLGCVRVLEGINFKLSKIENLAADTLKVVCSNGLKQANQKIEAAQKTATSTTSLVAAASAADSSGGISTQTISLSTSVPTTESKAAPAYLFTATEVIQTATTSSGAALSPTSGLIRKFPGFLNWRKGVVNWVQNGTIPIYVTNIELAVTSTTTGRQDTEKTYLICLITKKTKNLDSIIKEGRLAALSVQDGRVKAVAYHSNFKRFINAGQYSQYYAIAEEETSELCSSFGLDIKPQEISSKVYTEMSDLARSMQK